MLTLSEVNDSSTLTVYGTYAYTMLLILLRKGGDWTIIYFQYWEMNFTMRDLQVG